MPENRVKLAAQWLEENPEIGSRGLRLYLRQCQEAWNWVPADCLELAGEHFQLSMLQVREIALLNGSISLEPQGEVVIEICQGLACSDAHSGDILKNAEKSIGIKNGETSQDGKWTLKNHYCFGRCAIGPNVRINQKFHSNQDWKTLEVALKKLEKSS